MNISEFDLSVGQLNRLCASIVDAKRPEYTEGNVDVLYNFKQVAAEAGVTPLQVWYTYFRKHIASLARFAANPTGSFSEPIPSRFADAKNYLDLGFAIYQELYSDATRRPDPLP